jgi:DNA-binding NarL/FixJ family response regulator
MPTSNRSAAIRVVLVDDHDLLRDGMRALFERLPEVSVVGEARDGRAGLELIRREQPDIAFVDISMPVLNGLDLIRQTRATCPKVRMIVLSMHPSELLVSESIRAGAHGYLLKQNANLAELQTAIRSVLGGGQYMTAGILPLVLEGLRSRDSSSAWRLTPRQREVLQMIGEGRGTKEIASALKISIKTVETHRSDLMDRLGIREVAGLVRYAIQTGLVTME